VNGARACAAPWRRIVAGAAPVMAWLAHLAVLAVLSVATATGVGAYPLDGYEDTGIRRLEYVRRVVSGELSGAPVPRGARLPTDEVRPRLLLKPGSVKTGSETHFGTDSSVSKWVSDPVFTDPGFSAAIRRALGADAERYGVAVYDLSDPARPVYAEHNGGFRNNVGSVGKLLVALAWFQALADLYPEDLEARGRLLRDTVLAADEFVVRDHHRVTFFDPVTTARQNRVIVPGDRGNLWEWLDWMLSASNNGAAAFVQQQVMLLRHFGADYPPTDEQKARFYAEHGRAARGELFLAAMVEPLERNGFDPAEIRQGSFFTATGNSRVPTTSSYGTPRELVRFLYRLERGQLVDEWSSTEIKRLLYMTQRRIRYASHPVLQDYAVYFKSGSLYRCVPEEGFVCRQYEGNALNLLGSTAIVEGPVPGRRYHYLVAVMSNVLRQNSAVAHQSLALRIHRLIEARHAEVAQ
jgi:hypothetical protein